MTLYTFCLDNTLYVALLRQMRKIKLHGIFALLSVGNINSCQRFDNKF